MVTQCLTYRIPQADVSLQDVLRGLCFPQTALMTYQALCTPAPSQKPSLRHVLISASVQPYLDAGEACISSFLPVMLPATQGSSSGRHLAPRLSSASQAKIPAPMTV